ncbi:trehalose-phosphatase [Falsirhodobacter sp. alg1]|uniref:trehalose-phosphatase n=1 Tax=Falsirhodobacter sp. alg1 TaxID=1472418 RepID=UPI0005EF234D|nr:trehalose-phosphatase [Falsirhodobacter sp. alg1]
MPENPLSPLLNAPDDYALFLDIDGCLIDLADTPDGITIPEGLPALLAHLSKRLGGALALVTGREGTWVDRTFAPQKFPLAALHGFQMRQADGTFGTAPVPDGLDHARAHLASFAGQQGVTLEDKGTAIALHYRNAPERQQEVETTMRDLASNLGPAWELQFGKMVVEMRPAGATKGAAVRSFMESAPFAGRKPVTIGDDITDETMFPVANEMGGISIRIAPPDQPTAAQAHLPDTATLRNSLKRVAQWDV